MPYKVRTDRLPKSINHEQAESWCREVNRLMTCRQCSELVKTSKVHTLFENDPEQYATALIVDTLLAENILYEIRYDFYAILSRSEA